VVVAEAQTLADAAGWVAAGQRRGRGGRGIFGTGTGRVCSGGVRLGALQTVPQEFVALVHVLLSASRSIAACGRSH